jgi:hypothetical protein
VPVPGRPHNPEGELPLRFRERAHVSIALAGETPGTMERSLRGCVLAPGVLRRLWRQTVTMIPAMAGYSWSSNGAPGLPQLAFAWTRALRYMASSRFLRAGNDETRFASEYRSYLRHQSREPLPTQTAGTRINRPTVRNRLTSFGSRVQPINGPVSAAEEYE